MQMPNRIELGRKIQRPVRDLREIDKPPVFIDGLFCQVLRNLGTPPQKFNKRDTPSTDGKSYPEIRAHKSGLVKCVMV